MKIALSIGICIASEMFTHNLSYNYYIQYFNTFSFPLMSLAMTVCCQRNPLSASAPKESSKNNYQ